MTEPQIQVLIVDDEAPAREKLSRYVAQCPLFSVVAEAKNGQQALDAMRQGQGQGQHIKILSAQDICFIRSEHRLIHIYDHSGHKYWTNESLTQLEKRLDPHCFMRIHRNSMVNLTAKFAIQSYHSGRLKLLFDFAEEGVVSREHVSAFKAYLGWKS